MASYKELLEQIRRNRMEHNRLEKELEEIENSPVNDTDVVVKYTGSMGTDYSVNRITNRSKEQMRELLEKLTETEYEEWDGNLEEYLVWYGAEVIPVLSTAESRWDGYPPFYDLEYDIDTNKVYDSNELSFRAQAENYVNRIEFGEGVFNDEERNLVIHYAHKLGDMESTFAFARALRDTDDIQMRNQIINNAKNEIELFTGQENQFGIYRLKSGDELRYHRFEPLDRLEQYGRKVEKANYDLVYIATLREGQSLEDILYRPEEFRGHSLSVSDIVLIHTDGENHSYYVDQGGFQEVPQFQEQIKAQISVTNMERSFIDHYYVIEDLQKQGPLDIKRFQNMDEALQEYFRLPNDKRKAFGVQNSQPMPGTLDFLQCKNGVDNVILDYEVLKGWNNPEIVDVVQKVEEAIDVHDVMIAYKVGNRYLAIQSTAEGFDYTIYSSDYREWDGGVYDNPLVSVSEAIDGILEDQILGFEDCKVISYDALMEVVEERNRITEQDQNRIYTALSEKQQTLTYYVAECMEFPGIGEYHDNLTLDEAVQLYEAIPEERMNGIKGIGFVLHTKDNGKDMELTMDLLSGMTIDVDTINYVPEFRDSPLVQQAIKDIIQRYPDMEVWDVETRAREARESAKYQDKVCMDFAVDFDHFVEDYDTYGYGDSVENKEENIMRIYSDLCDRNDEAMRQWLQDVIDEEKPVEDVKQAGQLLERLDDLEERRAKNLLTKIEELKEENYNQIDESLNNMGKKEGKKTEKKAMSIMERIERGKRELSGEDMENKNPKDTMKKTERGID